MTLIPGFLKRGFESALTPLASGLVAAGVRPNAITTVGTLILVGSAVAFAAGQIRLGAVLLLVSGVFDMLDGRVARAGGGETKFGAFYDSTLDRIGESALYGGIIVFFIRTGLPEAWMVAAVATTVVALAAGLIVSYARARAEGLGLECKVGIAQRAERVLGLGVPSLLFGAGPRGMLLFAVVAVLSVVAVITVVQRILHVRKAVRAAPRHTQARVTIAAMAESLRKGQQGD
jgi:CDP-diacylglycerol--glycerol-3-phosphate 3-phosphatidyltransferase